MNTKQTLVMRRLAAESTEHPRSRLSMKKRNEQKILALSSSHLPVFLEGEGAVLRCQKQKANHKKSLDLEVDR